MDRDGNVTPVPSPIPNLPDQGGLTNSVSPELCSAYRDHLDTKIGDMETNIKNTIQISISVAGLGLAVLQLALHFFG